MAPKLRTLLESGPLQLSLLTPQLPDQALDEPVHWVHSSDLVDPTPFLEPQHVLLTTGTQFEGENDEFLERYVERLRDRGVVGLGFGTDVIRAGTPAGLVAACLRHGLLLFEVPYQTPFIAVVQEVAGMLARETYARQTWALAAQRAITRAALRPDGLNATLSELSQQLGAWVALYDAAGELDRFFPGRIATSKRDVVGGEVRQLLKRGRRAGGTVDLADGTVTLQTLGRGDRLSGVLAIGGNSPLDRASAGVVESVIALAGLALEQNRDLQRARASLRAGLLHALLAGGHALAARISLEMWGPLPPEPLQAATAVVGDPARDAVTDFLELKVDRNPEALFFAQQDEELVLVLGPEGRTLPAELAERFGLAVGVSNDVGWAELPVALRQARQARDRAPRPEAGVTRFETLARAGILAVLSGTEAATIGEGMLAPLDGHDSQHGTNLRRTLLVWLESDGRFDTAADTLGVHRHTVRNRVRLIEQLLGRDLRPFSARADIWAALLVTSGNVGD